MPPRHQVQCINKTDRYNAHERIENIGGVEGGQRWRLTQAEGIAAIESGRANFYVNRGGYESDVIVAVSRYGYKYLKTKADGEQPDNLLSLPECPRW